MYLIIDLYVSTLTIAMNVNGGSILIVVMKCV